MIESKDSQPHEAGEPVGNSGFKGNEDKSPKSVSKLLATNRYQAFFSEIFRLVMNPYLKRLVAKIVKRRNHTQSLYLLIAHYFA